MVCERPDALDVRLDFWRRIGLSLDCYLGNAALYRRMIWPLSSFGLQTAGGQRFTPPLGVRLLE